MLDHVIYKNITIVTVTHNSEIVLNSFLNSLDIKFRLIIIDNDSKDNTKKILKKFKSKGKNIKIIFNKIGLGFGSAANLGLKKSKTKYVLLTNPDTKLDFKSISKLYLAAKKYPNAAILCPLHKNNDGNIHLPTKPFFYNGKQELLNSNNFKGDCSVEHLSGAIMLLDAKKTKKIGFFDENFFFILRR